MVTTIREDQAGGQGTGVLGLLGSLADTGSRCESQEARCQAGADEMRQRQGKLSSG